MSDAVSIWHDDIEGWKRLVEDVQDGIKNDLLRRWHQYNYVENNEQALKILWRIDQNAHDAQQKEMWKSERARLFETAVGALRGLSKEERGAALTAVANRENDL